MVGLDKGVILDCKQFRLATYIIKDKDLRMRRFSFSGERSGFDTLDTSYVHDTSWYKQFRIDKALALFEEHSLQYLSEHAVLDFLIKCRESLAVGGRLRIAEPDWLHPSSDYISHAAQFKPELRLGVKGWTEILHKVGFLTLPIEFRDDTGSLHSFEPNFESFGTVVRSARLDPRSKDPSLMFSSIIVDAIKIDEHRKSIGYANKIPIIGDSHVRFVAGKDEHGDFEDEGICPVYDGFCAKFVGWHLGPGLAFNVNREGTKTRAREKIERILDSGKVKSGSHVMFSFGEIDCRSHVVRQSEKLGKPMTNVIDDVCSSYVSMLERVAKRGFRPMVWAPFASTRLSYWGDQEHPVYGTYEARNEAISLFNNQMRTECSKRKFVFVNISDDIKNAQGEVDQMFFADDIHLSQKARPLLRKRFPSHLSDGESGT